MLRVGHAYEIAHIMRSGLERMYGTSGPEGNGENVIFYLTVYNEPVSQPAEPEDVDVEGIVRGIHRVARSEHPGPKVQLLGSGTILREVLAAAELARVRKEALLLEVGLLHQPVREVAEEIDMRAAAFMRSRIDTLRAPSRVRSSGARTCW